MLIALSALSTVKIIRSKIPTGPNVAQLMLGSALLAERSMGKVYIYVVARDFGFAPNPFHGICTLATCKPGIRKKADVGDWVLGLGGSRLKATGRCVFAMRVSGTTSFNEYWSNPAFNDKKPVRNGSSRMLVGDNIYHFDSETQKWDQADSHHSHPDGSVNFTNLRTDTQTDIVLISDFFYYFGKAAPFVPSRLLDEIRYKNRRNYRVFTAGECSGLIAWIQDSFGKSLNLVTADPFEFDQSDKRYTGHGSKII